jgi:hypothetical protein
MRHMIARVLIMLLLLIAPHPGPAAAREPPGDGQSRDGGDQGDAQRLSLSRYLTLKPLKTPVTTL